MKCMMMSILALGLVGGANGNKGGKGGGGACTDNKDCESGQICSNNHCESLCISNAQRDGECCVSSLCEPCQGVPPVVTSVDGTGSADGAAEHTDHRLRDRLVITGEHLADATAACTKLSDPGVTHRQARWARIPPLTQPHW